jgi:hypothetical protein
MPTVIVTIEGQEQSVCEEDCTEEEVQKKQQEILKFLQTSGFNLDKVTIIIRRVYVLIKA